MRDEISNHIREILQEIDMSLLELARRARVHRNTLNKIIHQGAVPRLDVANRIAKVLGRSIYDIWDLD